MRQEARLAAATTAASIILGIGIIDPACAQSYPAKPIRLVVAAAPGGNMDIVARAVAQKLTESLGRPMIVENRPGANTAIGSENVARSAPDGYAYLMVAPSFLVGPMMTRNAPYDPVRDFTGVSLIATLPQMIVVHPSLPVKSVRELIALAKARPGELNCATSGNGSGSHLAMELFQRQAGVRMTRIPYNGDAPGVVHLLGGQVSLKFDNVSTSIPHVNAGRLRALGITSPRRSALLPDVPAIGETLPGYEASIFNGMVAPAGIPKEIVARIHGEIAKFVQAPNIRARFAQQGVELQSSPAPEQFTEYIKTEYTRLSRVIREAGIAPE
jgi:tripartite-type tricarboxylate transporter receptor subunit TctC